MCGEKDRLALEYQEATAQFSQSVADLREKMGTSSQEEYERLKRTTEQWRVRSEEARLAFEQHVAAHNC
jgi:CHASE3 domain sensor protein